MRAASTAWTESGTWKSGGSSPTDQLPFSRREHAHVDQRRNQLLDEERVALGPLEDRPTARERAARRRAARRASCPRPSGGSASSWS